MRKSSVSTRATLLVGSLFVLAAVCSTAPASAGGIASDLNQQIESNSGRGDKVRVIVQFAVPNADGGGLARAFGGKLHCLHPLINGATLSVPLSAVRALSNHPWVAWVSPDRRLGAKWDCADQTIAADQVWSSYGFRGTGITVAVIDSGIAGSMPDFCAYGTNQNRIVGWKDFINGATQPYDDYGHGTHVAGIVAGSGNDSSRLFQGVAPQANLVGVKVLDQTGCGLASTVVTGINWCVQNKSLYGIRVINLSLGHDPVESYRTDPLCAAARAAVKAGIVVVVSAGNKGKDPTTGLLIYGGISSPGNDPSVITVGASNTQQTTTPSDDTICSYSSRGPSAIDQVSKPDLVAPGNKIVSVRSPGCALDVSYPGQQVAPASYGSSALSSSYFILSGTSMASPMVAGSVALMLQANPGLGPNTVKGILMYTTHRMTLFDSLGLPLTTGISTLTQGSGCLNTAGAVEMATRLDTTAPVGAGWLKSGLSKQNVIGGVPVIWNQQIYYGNQVLWGDQILSVRQVLWGEQVTWGDQVTWGGSISSSPNGVAADQVVWGSQVCWGESNISGESSASSECNPTAD